MLREQGVRYLLSKPGAANPRLLSRIRLVTCYHAAFALIEVYAFLKKHFLCLCSVWYFRVKGKDGGEHSKNVAHTLLQAGHPGLHKSRGLPSSINSKNNW